MNRMAVSPKLFSFVIRGPRKRVSRNDGLLLLPGLGAKTGFLLAQFGRQRLAKILRVEDLPNFNFRAAVERCALHPFDCLVPRLDLNQPEAGNKIASPAEGALGDGALLAGIFDAGAFRTRMQAFPR